MSIVPSVNNNLLKDIYFVIEHDFKSLIVYTKIVNNGVAVGITNGLQVWTTDIDIKPTADGDQLSSQNYISHLHTGLRSRSVEVSGKAEGQSVDLRIGLTNPVTLTLHSVSLPASEIQQLLIALARHSMKQQEENDTIIKQTKSSPPKSISLVPRFKPPSNNKVKKSIATVGMSTINPTSKKMKRNVQGVEFGD